MVGYHIHLLIDLVTHAGDLSAENSDNCPVLRHTVGKETKQFTVGLSSHTHVCSGSGSGELTIPP